MTTDEITFKLRASGLKATPARTSLLKFFASVAKPVDAHEIIRTLKNTDQATIYRALKNLTAKGLVRQIDFQKGKSYFEINDRHHHHVICENCSKIKDVDCDVKDFEKEVLKSSGFKSIKDHALEFYGLCASCAKLA